MLLVITITVKVMLDHSTGTMGSGYEPSIMEMICVGGDGGGGGALVR